MQANLNLDYWIEHFRRNAEDRMEPNWSAPVTLRGVGLAKLIRSLQQFQLGDGGGPAYLIAWDRNRLLESDPNFKELVDLWFAEEREHSRLLGETLRRFFAEPIDGHWSFGLFCAVRKWLGVDFELQALLLTEIVSHVYYKMLRQHVQDEAVRGMCELIIRDEAGHIAFHRARLVVGGKSFRWWGEWVFRLRGILAGTVLWVNHRGALRAAGATDGEFYRRIWKGMGNFINGVRDDFARLRDGGRMKPTVQMVAECR